MPAVLVLDTPGLPAIAEAAARRGRSPTPRGLSWTHGAARQVRSSKKGEVTRTPTKPCKNLTPSPRLSGMAACSPGHDAPGVQRAPQPEPRAGSGDVAITFFDWWRVAAGWPPKASRPRSGSLLRGAPSAGTPRTPPQSGFPLRLARSADAPRTPHAQTAPPPRSRDLPPWPSVGREGWQPGSFLEASWVRGGGYPGAPGKHLGFVGVATWVLSGSDRRGRRLPEHPRTPQPRGFPTTWHAPLTLRGRSADDSVYAHSGRATWALSSASSLASRSSKPRGTTWFLPASLLRRSVM